MAVTNAKRLSINDLLDAPVGSTLRSTSTPTYRWTKRSRNSWKAEHRISNPHNSSAYFCTLNNELFNHFELEYPEPAVKEVTVEDLDKALKGSKVYARKGDSRVWEKREDGSWVGLTNGASSFGSSGFFTGGNPRKFADGYTFEPAEPETMDEFKQRVRKVVEGLAKKQAWAVDEVVEEALKELDVPPAPPKIRMMMAATAEEITSGHIFDCRTDNLFEIKGRKHAHAKLDELLNAFPKNHGIEVPE